MKHLTGKGHVCSSSSRCLPRDAGPSRPGWPILPFSFFPKRRPMEDLMLFFLLDLCRESWLLLELLPSADRLQERRGGAQDTGAPPVKGKDGNSGCLTCGSPVGHPAWLQGG